MMHSKPQTEMTKKLIGNCKDVLKCTLNMLLFLYFRRQASRAKKISEFYGASTASGRKG